MPGGFHPFHAGHASLYHSAVKAFPNADVYVAATNDTKTRPFPFSIKEKLAKLAGVAPGHFVQVKSPFKSEEITSHYNPEEDVLIFVRSEKDRTEQPKPGGKKKDGTPAYFQPWTGKNLQPFSKHAYIAYLPTVEFGPGITSATEIRKAWPTLSDKRKTAMVMSLYPATQKNPKLAANVVKMLDMGMGGQEDMTEGSEQITEYRNRLLQYVKSLLPTWPEYVLKDWLVPNKGNFSNLPPDALKNSVMEKVKGAGLTPNSKWQLVPDMKFTMDMFDPMTKQRLVGRAGGTSDLGMGIPRDKERHATQAALAQQQGGVRKEPVLLIKTAKGYELLEGWHRTIQHFHKFPDGYTGPAYVAVAQGQQGVAEGSDFFAGSKFADEEGNTFSVEKIIAFAKKNPKYFRKDFPLSKIKHDLSWWQGNKERMMNADTSFPLLVIQNDDGHLGVADGLNRMKKAVDVEKKQTIDVYLVPKKDIMKFSEKQGVEEARTNPEQNRKSGSGKYDLINYAEDNINDKDNWAVSMTMEPKLGINPQAAVSEDTPKGIYFYPLRYFMQMADRDESLPWGDNFPYIQLFQYDRSGEMTQQTKVDPAKLKQALLQYCPEEVIQQVSEEGEYDGTPYWFIYDCLSRLGKSDETNVIRWNKILRELGFTSVYDPGKGWIAYNEPTQGVVLDPRIIKQHKMFDNRNPTLQNRRYDIQGLADAIGWSSYYQRESQLQRIYNHPDEKKVMLDVAKSMLKPFLGKNDKEAKEMGYDQAIKAAADKVIEILKQPVTEDKESDPVTSAVLNFYKPVVNDIHKEKLPDYVDQARGLLQKTNDPEVRSKLVDIFKKGKENPYIQGGIVTTVGAVLAGGILTTAQKMGLSPAQTNLALQAILNTVIPTVVSRINGKNWSDTIKYTLASAGIGTGIAGASLIENDIPESIDYLEEK